MILTLSYNTILHTAQQWQRYSRHHILNSQKTPQRSPERAPSGVFIVGILGTIDQEKTEFHWTWGKWPWHIAQCTTLWDYLRGGRGIPANWMCIQLDYTASPSPAINLQAWEEKPELPATPAHTTNSQHTDTQKYKDKLCKNSHDMILCMWTSVPGPWFNIKMSSHQYRKSHCGYKTILWPSYLHNDSLISTMGFPILVWSLYWIGAQKYIQTSIHWDSLKWLGCLTVNQRLFEKWAN